MSTDRELLELAAKAAGYHWPLMWPNPSPVDVPHEWNPLTDDGDALRLAVELNMAVSIHNQHCMACAQTGSMQTVEGVPTSEATRRAIVKAAAEIGRSLTLKNSSPGQIPG